MLSQYTKATGSIPSKGTRKIQPMKAKISETNRCFCLFLSLSPSLPPLSKISNCLKKLLKIYTYIQHTKMDASKTMYSCLLESRWRHVGQHYKDLRDPERGGLLNTPGAGTLLSFSKWKTRQRGRHQALIPAGKGDDCQRALASFWGDQCSKWRLWCLHNSDTLTTTDTYPLHGWIVW